ncbi:hypothetical protein RB608_21690 [Nocardioides sp. LHD-245]|uniref:hypothetical protein n=1 Tax=Nocardioides sp. LHD-245 TaxID=3051387 RepID=UPI0027DEDE9B|nr:hypothetical protein [Nocardioides sp. LHD-245]
MRKRLTALAAIVTTTLGLGALTAPNASAATGWETVTSWEGGRTLVCATPHGDGTSTVYAHWDGRRYPTTGGQFREKGAGGLAHVSDGFAISGWTYSFGDKGTVGQTVSLQRPSNGWVYVLSGSQVGITVEAVVPVKTLATCPGAGRVVAPAARPAADGDAARAAKCVSKKEFRRIDKKMRPGAVKRALGFGGQEVTAAEFSAVRAYTRCQGGSVVVNFKRAGAGKPLKVDSRFKG